MVNVPDYVLAELEIFMCGRSCGNVSPDEGIRLEMEIFVPTSIALLRHYNIYFLIISKANKKRTNY
jgi:hypothetical protein